MKRFHVHLSVSSLDESIRFYSALFGAAPAVHKPDYAKWMLEDPRLNFAISTRHGKAGLDHLGLQADSAEELEALAGRVAAARGPSRSESGATCCYARSDKHWTLDPQGIVWESFHTLDSVPVYGEDSARAASLEGAGCCGPALPADKTSTCCGIRPAGCCAS